MPITLIAPYVMSSLHSDDLELRQVAAAPHMLIRRFQQSNVWCDMSTGMLK